MIPFTLPVTPNTSRSTFRQAEVPPSSPGEGADHNTVTVLDIQWLTIATGTEVHGLRVAGDTVVVGDPDKLTPPGCSLRGTVSLVL